MGSDINVLELTTMKYAGLPESVQNALRLRVRSTAGLPKDAAALKQRILEFIHYKTLENTPPKLGSLGRLFNRTAARMDSSAMQLIQDLADEGKIRVFERKNQSILLSTANLEERIAFSPNYIADYLEDLLSRAE